MAAKRRNTQGGNGLYFNAAAESVYQLTFSNEHEKPVR